jgi:hypothetical protein
MTGNAEWFEEKTKELITIVNSKKLTTASEIAEFCVGKRRRIELITVDEARRLTNQEIDWQGVQGGMVIRVVGEGLTKEDRIGDLYDGQVITSTVGFLYSGWGIFYRCQGTQAGQCFIGQFKRNYFHGSGLQFWIPSSAAWNCNHDVNAPNLTPYYFYGNMKWSKQLNGTMLFKDGTFKSDVAMQYNELGSAAWTPSAARANYRAPGALATGHAGAAASRY